MFPSLPIFMFCKILIYIRGWVPIEETLGDLHNGDAVYAIAYALDKVFILQI